MPDMRRTTGTYPVTSTQTRTIEQKRTMLRKAIVTRPDDLRLQEALAETLAPTHVQRAAARGVFMSYHRADELFTLELDNDLRNAGVRVWMDTIDVPAGADWRSEVVAALRGCGIMLLILSQAWLDDEDAATEHQFFLDTGKIVIPVLTETCDISRLTLAVPPVDFRRDRELGVRQLVRLLHQPAGV